jgi:hypothetical protein
MQIVGFSLGGERPKQEPKAEAAAESKIRSKMLVIFRRLNQFGRKEREDLEG